MYKLNGIVLDFLISRQRRAEKTIKHELYGLRHGTRGSSRSQHIRKQLQPDAGIRRLDAIRRGLCRLRDVTPIAHEQFNKSAHNVRIIEINRAHNSLDVNLSHLNYSVSSVRSAHYKMKQKLFTIVDIEGQEFQYSDLELFDLVAVLQVEVVLEAFVNVLAHAGGHIVCLRLGYARSRGRLSQYVCVLCAIAGQRWQGGHWRACCRVSRFVL